VVAGKHNAAGNNMRRSEEDLEQQKMVRATGQGLFQITLKNQPSSSCNNRQKGIIKYRLNNSRNETVNLLSALWFCRLRVDADIAFYLYVSDAF